MIKNGLEKEWETAKANNRDPYGGQVVIATEAIGKALDDGLSVKEAHDKMHGFGLTGFMAGCVAQWIAHFHPRGEEYRQWWNLENQIRDEGEKANKGKGVLNPALMTIETK